MAEEGNQNQSIQARIAALNLGQVGKAPVTAKPNNLALRPAQKPILENRRNSTNLPTHRSVSQQDNGIGNEPAGRSEVLPSPIITRTYQITGSPDSSSPAPRLPPRRSSTQKSPALPPRRPSEQLSRRDSNESVSSVVSSVSTFSNGTARTPSSRAPSMDRSRVRAPVYDPSTLPPLPPKRSQQEKEKETARIPLKGAKSSPSVTTLEIIPPPRTPTVPQRLPSHDHLRESGRKLPPRDPPPMPARTLTSPMTNGHTTGRTPSPTPPPVPMSSRPDLSRIMATKPKMPTVSSTPSMSSAATCLKCRDFSGPDNHAARFPRQTVPSLDWLAIQLTEPFSSPTDKARSIFTWLHHNVEYDVVAFFGKCVQPSTPASTLSTGLAVCEGYAGLFTVLAVKAGLEAITISGHGKGFGIEPISPGAPVPPESSNHAWNAFKDDSGNWKLIDSCWGAGNISGPGKPYNKDFTPNHFTDDNAEFSLGHFPTNRAHAFINPPMSWQEYILGDQGGEHVQIYSNIAPREGLSSTSFLPKYKRIPISHTSSTIRFQFSKVCPHWDPLVQGPGKPFVYVLATGIRKDGHASGEHIPFETDGRTWWLDVMDSRSLGRSGEGVAVYTVESVGGASGRGLSKEDYLAAKGRKGMGFGGVAAWELV